MALISPGFQLDGFPCIIGASKATANATVEEEDKGKLRKAQLSWEGNVTVKILKAD